MFEQLRSVALASLNRSENRRRRIRLMAQEATIRRGGRMNKTGGVLARVTSLVYNPKAKYRIIYQYGAENSWGMFHTTEWSIQHALEYKTIALEKGLRSLESKGVVFRDNLPLEWIYTRRGLQPGVYLYWREQNTAKVPTDILIFV